MNFAPKIEEVKKPSKHRAFKFLIGSLLLAYYFGYLDFEISSEKKEPNS